MRIAAPDVVELIILGPLLARIANEAPHMKIESAPFAYLSVDALFRQPLDVAIVAEPFASREVARAALFSESISCMVWRDGRHGGGLSESDYHGGRHVSISHPQERLSHPVGSALHRLSEGQNIVACARSYTTLPHAIIGTDLIVTTLTSYARLCATMLPVTVHPVPVAIPTINFVAQWQNYRGTSRSSRGCSRTSARSRDRVAA